MPRRVPYSPKKKRQQIQDKRAIKRGDLDPSEVRVPTHVPKVRSHLRTSNLSGDDARKLQSRFVALPAEYATRTRNLAYASVLPRPLPASAALFPVEIMIRDEGRLRCPVRPRFRPGATKKEVERNEEGVFVKWMRETEDIVRAWVEGVGPSDRTSLKGKEVDVRGPAPNDGEDHEWPRSPAWFETNLEVWRQLWRVSESSQILLLLLDARCPPVHCPPSLRTYVQALKPKKEVVLVLTKSDLVHPTALAGWREWARQWWGEDVGVVAVRSYDTELLQETGRHRPDMPQPELDELIDALQMAHARLLSPPRWATEDPEKLASWRPGVRSSIDWSLLGRGTAAICRPVSEDGSDSASEDVSEDEGSLPQQDGPEPGQGDGSQTVTQQSGRPARNPDEEPLTIGLIGQPNVGKSSLLNALLGEVKVRASRTPGKTKHFQTMYWGWKKEVMIVDCPGLVCPSLVGMELQTLAGVIQISQIPSLPACIDYAARLMPLETIFRIPEPAQTPLDPYASKRTWRGPRAEAEVSTTVRWTAGDLMEERAKDRGYLTAQSGRPDANRAADGLMRAMADGKVKWGFWPPQCDVSDREGLGIWLSRGSLGDTNGVSGENGTDSEDELDFDDTEEEVETGEAVEPVVPAGKKAPSRDKPAASHRRVREVAGELDSEADEEGEDETPVIKASAGRFAALDLHDDEEEEEQEQEEEEEEE